MTKKIKLTSINKTITEASNSDFECNTYKPDYVVIFSDGKEYKLSDDTQLDAFLQRVQNQLGDANKTIYDIGVLMGCDEAEIKEIQPDFCVDQEALNKVNAYLTKWGVK